MLSGLVKNHLKGNHSQVNSFMHSHSFYTERNTKAIFIKEKEKTIVLCFSFQVSGSPLELFITDNWFDV